jgi:hypothetical protein
MLTKILLPMLTKNIPANAHQNIAANAHQCSTERKSKGGASFCSPSTTTSFNAAINLEWI